MAPATPPPGASRRDQAAPPGRPDSDTHDLGPSAETTTTDRPGRPEPERPGETTTAEPEVISTEAPPAPEPPPPPPPIDRYAVGTHVVADTDGGPAFGIVLESGVLPGATEASYRIGWTDDRGGRRYSHAEIETTREHAKREHADR